MNVIDLEGRCAVITGGAQGIGRAVAERLLDSGALVALWDTDAERVKTTANELSRRGRVHALALDVTDADAVQHAAETTAEIFRCAR